MTDLQATPHTKFPTSMPSRPRPVRTATAFTSVLFAVGSVATLASLVLLTACTTSGPGRVGPHDAVLRQVHERGGKLGWDGLQVGMTFAEVERAVGERLPSPTGPDEICTDRYWTSASLLRQELTLSFTGSTQSARLASITIQLPGGFEPASLVPRLESRLGPLEFIPSLHEPTLGPTQIAKPLYRTRHGGLIFLFPQSGIAIGDVCYD